MFCTFPPGWVQNRYKNMYIKTLVYDNPFDMNPIVSQGTESVLEAEALVRNLVEKYEQIISQKHA